MGHHHTFGSPPPTAAAPGSGEASLQNGDTAAPPGPHSLSDLVEAVRASWETSGAFTEQTLARCGETILRFARRQAALGQKDVRAVTPAQCQDFITAHTAAGRPPELSTMHARRTALRMLFRTLRELGHDIGDPTLDLALPARTTTTARPLTDTEVVFCRTTARLGDAGSASLQRAVAWALGETTAVSSEVAAIRIRDVDNPTQPRWVHLPGTRRHDPRLGELTDWGSLIVARQIQVLTERRCPPATLLAYSGTGQAGQAGAQASVCNALGAVLKFAGLGEEPDVRPASLRNWAGRRLFDGGMPIEQVAVRMGSRTLDSAAADIALTWRPS